METVACPESFFFAGSFSAASSCNAQPDLLPLIGHTIEGQAAQHLLSIDIRLLRDGLDPLSGAFTQTTAGHLASELWAWSTDPAQ